MFLLIETGEIRVGSEHKVVELSLRGVLSSYFGFKQLVMLKWVLRFWVFSVYGLKGWFWYYVMDFD